MVFSSIEFIFIFFPIFLVSYYLVPGRLRNLWLFAGSILFYTLGSLQRPEHVALFVLSLLFNYLCGRLIARYDSDFCFLAGVGINLLYLASFKYLWQILPIGISFYTFQAISYLCDVRSGKCSAERSFVNFGTYLSMFPQLIAGPIVPYPMVSNQIHERKYELGNVVRGLQIFIMGLGSKVLLANQIGTLWRQLSVIGYESISTPLAWLGLIAYTFQIYFDFWGYSLMAIGLGKMLGFALPQNFDYPYLSTSMTEFWRRWHITLGSWFKEYVYIPLGGNRGSKAKTFRNLFIVWVLTGIWHGSSWNFALWGLFIFVLIVLEKAGWKKVLDRYKIPGHLYMMVVIPLSWAVFAHDEWGKLTCFFGRLFAVGNVSGSVYTGDYIKYIREYGICLLLCLLFTTRIPQKLWQVLKRTYTGQLLLAGIFVAAVYFLYIGLDNPFLYYQF